jgi:predicted kinase
MMYTTLRTVIFDIDGTLSNPEHRLHYVTNGKKDWDAFLTGCGEDTPYQEIIDLCNAVENTCSHLLLVTGRSERFRETTEEWLERHGVRYRELHMRPEGDYRPDYVIKSEILDRLLADGHEIDFVVDDRQTVIDMWRSRGLTCLQCRPWEDVSEPVEYGLLTLMIGPSGAGKSDWLVSDQARELGIRQSQVVSSDAIRHDMLDDFKDQTQNDRVFKALHKIVKQRLVLGLPTVIDATNLKRKDRLDCVSLANGNPVRYVVIDTPEATVRTRGGWRNELGFDLIGKHFQTFNSQKADILKGDKLPNVEVLVVNA